jgi:hypothetical protein
MIATTIADNQTNPQSQIQCFSRMSVMICSGFH